MDWLSPPLHDKHAFWEPEWGLHFLTDRDDPRDKTTAIFGAPDDVLEKKLDQKLLKNLFGDNREVFSIHNNGTTAVIVALAEAAPPSTVTLVSIGSYAGEFRRNNSFFNQLLITISFVFQVRLVSVNGSVLYPSTWRIFIKDLGWSWRGLLLFRISRQSRSGQGSPTTRKICV